MKRLVDNHFRKVRIFNTAPSLCEIGVEDDGDDKKWEATRRSIVEELNIAHNGRINANLAFSYNHFWCSLVLPAISSAATLIVTSTTSLHSDCSILSLKTCVHTLQTKIINTTDPDTGILGVEGLCNSGDLGSKSWAQVVSSAFALDEYRPWEAL